MTLYLISKCKGFDDINDVLQEMYMEYFRTIQKKGIEYVDDEEAFLIALCKRKLSVEFGDLGVYDDHLDVKVDNDGTWRFEWELSGDSTSVTKETHTVLEDTGAVVTECEVSQISIRAVLDISGAKNMTSDKKYAVLSGVKLKDGTMLTDIVESGNENTNTSGAICNNKQFRTKNNNKIGCSKKLVLIIYNNRKSVYYNMQQSVVQIADFRRSQAGAEIRTAIIAVGAPCLCDLSRNESNQT